MNPVKGKQAILMVEYSYNRYSLAVLTGILEADGRFEDLDIHFRKAARKDSLEDSRHEELLQNILLLARQYQRLVVAFSFHTPNVAAMGYTLQAIRAELQKQQMDNVLILAGGPHPSGDPLGTVQLGVDVVVLGEAELTLPELLDRIFQQKSLEDLKGIAFLDDQKKYRFTGRAPQIDLNDYPPFSLKSRRFAPLEIGRGCAFACSFCQTPFLMGAKMRYRSIENIIHWAKQGKDAGYQALRFLTPTAFTYGSVDGQTLHLDLLEDLLKGVSQIFGKEHVFFGSFPSEVRPETVTHQTLSLVKKYCTNDNIIIGAQSGSNRMLSEVHRGHGTEEVEEAVRLLLEYGYQANVDFIFGMPGETEEDLAQTLEFMLKLTRLGARVHSHTFMPLVGTPLSSAAPGVVSPAVRKMLEELRLLGLEYGHWKQQELIAKESTAFLEDLLQERPDELKGVRAFKRQ
ncbi:TIGR04013 family B12-binding domain/radical SAM domain-containing protein [Deinococcus roseus]|uniref:B12-binding domain-containing radical SAM protein n=1 Tax=Deinococcus roseus TaxID=392414 RepID=A0ABQ2DA54_9DEIO|nr:TIGR04013 family B12-binding domain/radical SAM domain-containing protein [Deinococcus roseus]GGJ48924.1 B12-binding domain-containing radical SAM protein [Deinococcus roseus]